MKFICLILVVAMMLTGCSINGNENIEVSTDKDNITADFKILELNENYWVEEMELVEDIQLQLKQFGITEEMKEDVINHPEKYGTLSAEIEVVNNTENNLIVSDISFPGYGFVNMDNFISPKDLEISKDSQKHINVTLLVDLEQFSDSNNTNIGSVSLCVANDEFEVLENSYFQIDVTQDTDKKIHNIGQDRGRFVLNEN